MAKTKQLTTRNSSSLTPKQKAKLELFKSKGIENLVHSHELIPLGDGKYKLVAHKDITPVFDNISGSRSNGSFSYSSRLMGDSSRMTPDEQKLFILNGGCECGVELRETISIGRCCL